MNPINLQLIFVDGSTRQVTATAADLIAFESHFNLSVSVLAKDPRLTYMFYLGWAVDKRTKGTELSFEEWTETISLVTEGAEEVKK